MHISSTVYKCPNSKTALKCPYYGLWKVYVLGVSNNRLTCMRGQKTLSLSYNMHVFLPYLLNDSFFQTPPLRHVNLQWLVRLVSFSSHHACNAWLSICECSAALCTALPRHLVSKKKFAVSFRPTRKDQQVGGQYANVSCWRQHETAWDSF